MVHWHDERSAVEQRAEREDGQRMGGNWGAGRVLLAAVARKLAAGVLTNEPRWCYPCSLAGRQSETAALVNPVEPVGRATLGAIPLCRSCYEMEAKAGLISTSSPYTPSDVAQLALEVLATLGPEGGR